MPNRFRPLPGAVSTVRRRVLTGITVLALATALAGLLAYLTRADAPFAAPKPPTTTVSGSATATPSPSATADVGVTLAKPPSTHDPVAFGKAAAQELWSYDTRRITQAEQMAALHVWLTDETKYADWDSVAAQVPSPQVWQGMHAESQYATAAVSEGHIPAAFTQALNADPGAITQAYIYAVTVSGTQSIAWNGAPRGGAENRSVTLAVQCRPAKPCALAGVMPNIAP